MNFVRFACLVALFSVAAPQGYAQQEGGDVELGLQGFFFSQIGDSSSNVSGSIQGKFGVYLGDHVELGIGPTVTFAASSGRNRITGREETNVNATLGTSVFLTYTILAGAKAVPYFGAQFYKPDLGNSDDNGTMGVNFGLKFFISRKAAFDINGNYLLTLNPGSERKFFYLAFGINFLL